MAPPAAEDDLVFSDGEDGEDFVIVDDLDFTDESELRRVVGEVEAIAGNPHGRGLRVSVLTAEQWKTVVARVLPPAMRRAQAHLYLHTLRDPNDQQHLLVSPSAVQAINEGQASMYEDVIYAALRCLPSDLAPLLRRGIDDLIAREIGERINVQLYTRHHPRERRLASHLLAALYSHFGYTELEWALQLRRQPKRCLLALRHTPFAPYWEKRSEKPFKELLETLSARKLNFEMPLLAEAEELLERYVEEEVAGKAKEGGDG